MYQGARETFGNMRDAMGRGDYGGAMNAAAAGGQGMFNVGREMAGMGQNMFNRGKLAYGQGRRY